MSLQAMLDDLPTGCDVGTKKNSKGYKDTWVGYKLHLDVADGQIPISCLLTSASLHDSQAAIPLATLSAERTTNLYDLMDAAYDAESIRRHSRSLGHVPLIDVNPRGDKALAEELRTESRRLERIGFQLPEQVRYNERTAGERVNGRLKDEFGGRHVRGRPGPRRLEGDVPLHVRRARTHRRPARAPGDIASAPPATPIPSRCPTRRQPSTGVPTHAGKHVETSCSHLVGFAAGPPEPEHAVGNPGQRCSPGSTGLCRAATQEFCKRLRRRTRPLPGVDREQP